METMQQVAAVVGVLAILCGTLWWLRRRGYAVPAGVRRGPGRRMECMERISLGPQQTLHLVRFGGRGLLVASSPAGCTLLHNLDWRDIASGPEASR